MNCTEISFRTKRLYYIPLTGCTSFLTITITHTKQNTEDNNASYQQIEHPLPGHASIIMIISNEITISFICTFTIATFRHHHRTIFLTFCYVVLVGTKLDLTVGGTGRVIGWNKLFPMFNFCNLSLIFILTATFNMRKIIEIRKIGTFIMFTENSQWNHKSFSFRVLL